MQAESQKGPGNFRDRISGRRCWFPDKFKAIVPGHSRRWPGAAGPKSEEPPASGQKVQVSGAPNSTHTGHSHSKRQLHPCRQLGQILRLIWCFSSSYPPTSNLSTNPVGFTFKFQLEFDHFPAPPQMVRTSIISHWTVAVASLLVSPVPIPLQPSSSSTGSQRNHFECHVKTYTYINTQYLSFS